MNAGFYGPPGIAVDDMKCPALRGYPPNAAEKSKSGRKPSRVGVGSNPPAHNVL
jgi:hypothetical protein